MRGRRKCIREDFPCMHQGRLPTYALGSVVRVRSAKRLMRGRATDERKEIHHEVQALGRGEIVGPIQCLLVSD
uniref:Uncharacterized protein n=1 Tax=Tanacetum cinerariifolium TaxID=118510 RepID=A0A699SYP9_TANCI|nr:hypothetical protein [Tanacetum cinerariifolium]